MGIEKSVKQLEGLMCTNFTAGDFFITLCLDNVPETEDGSPDEQQFRKQIRQYIKKLGSVYLEHGKEFKYLLIIEHAGRKGPVRMHAHLLVPKVESKIEYGWKDGFCGITPIKPDFRALAWYMLKDPTLETRKRKWIASAKMRQEAQVEKNINRGV